LSKFGGDFQGFPGGFGGDEDDGDLSKLMASMKKDEGSGAGGEKEKDKEKGKEDEEDLPPLEDEESTS